MNVIGSTKLQHANESVESIMAEFAEKFPDVRINDVAVVIDISYDRHEHGSKGSLVYACSDERQWVQEAFFNRAAGAVLEEEAEAE